jgi:hypothetical protein
LFRRILGEPEFLSGEIHTKWLDELLGRPRPPAVAPRGGTEEACAIAAAFWEATQISGKSDPASAVHTGPSRWKTEGRKQQVDRQP